MPSPQKKKKSRGTKDEETLKRTTQRNALKAQRLALTTSTTSALTTSDNDAFIKSGETTFHDVHDGTTAGDACMDSVIGNKDGNDDADITSTKYSTGIADALLTFSNFAQRERVRLMKDLAVVGCNRKSCMTEATLIFNAEAKIALHFLTSTNILQEMIAMRHLINESSLYLSCI